MKSLFAGLALMTLVAAVGCNRSASENPKVTAKAPNAGEQSGDSKATVVKKPVAGEVDETFSLSVPFDTVAIPQGGEQPVLIGINRGKDFREQVAINVTGLPEGVTLETADPVIKQGSLDVKLMLKAAADASLGDFTVKVTGHTASSGADFSKDLKLTVSQH